MRMTQGERCNTHPQVMSISTTLNLSLGKDLIGWRRSTNSTSVGPSNPAVMSWAIRCNSNIQIRCNSNISSKWWLWLESNILLSRSNQSKAIMIRLRQEWTQSKTRTNSKKLLRLKLRGRNPRRRSIGLQIIQTCSTVIKFCFKIKFLIRIKLLSKMSCLIIVP